MVGVRAKDHDDKRQLILDRAAELFARQGYHKTSISEIAKACNVTSKAWIYHYFPNKDAMLVTLLSEVVEALTKRAHAAIAQAATPQARLRAFLLTCLQVYDEYRLNYPTLFTEMGSLPEESQEQIRAAERRCTLLLHGIVVEINPEIASRRRQSMALTMLAFGTVNWTYTWFQASGPLTLEAVADMATQMLIGGIASVPGGAGLSPPAHDRRASAK
ncbi:MAG: TetR/AcrR family transcriptional regulator [Pseudomonadota bacterium]|jgi:AcrR family transcriptional regulator|nr:TetR family transcriptional regulator [Rubrivivax sp.]MCA3257974.1 TetR family transcriptional regulator [Rubrivivax sp.]MCE2911409.1 TetR/AcrR family transcriptional regulator [Rubrivivax sp.]MCZ8032323.1 TetR/AcrR family transcriptional regulator [Rubrivivax sp.]